MFIYSGGDDSSVTESCVNELIPVDDYCVGCIKFMSALTNPLAIVNFGWRDLRGRYPCTKDEGKNNVG